MSRPLATLQVQVRRIHFESVEPVDRELLAGRLRGALQARFHVRGQWQGDHVADAIADRLMDQIGRMAPDPAIRNASQREDIAEANGA